MSSELTFYVNPGWSPRIRPAATRRDWMEGTPERFAYRCLPLAIANAHGWELLSPCGFEARWNGGAGADAVEIRLDAGAEPRQAPVSLFGHGTVTFHVEAIIRTSPGWNLWVGGSPNAAKDGIAPLGGVIETDWSPYSFTMNWRFTRPGHWVRFDEDEPFCFLFPLERGVLQTIEPDIRPLDDAPEIRDAFVAWSRSRDGFHEEMRRNPPSAPADKWQKLYYRGLDPEGRNGTTSHEAKLRLAPAIDRAGTAAPGCPVAHVVADRPEVSPMPETARPVPADVPILSDAMMKRTLGEIGFDSGAPADGRVEPSTAPAAAALSATDAERALARRNWILDVAERQRALAPDGGTVPRMRELASAEFLERFYAPGRPVVIEGAMADWPALAKWTPDYLSRTVGSAPIEFQGSRGSSQDFELYKDHHRQTLPFDRFIALIEGDGGGNDAYLTAFNSGQNRDALAILDADLGPLDALLTGGTGMMWIGPMGTFTPLHFDLTNNLLAQVVGTKHLILAPPSETWRLAHRRHVFSDVHDLTDPDQLARYPLAADARTFEVELNAGDLIYIPVGWWHQVTSLEFSVMLTYTNFRWPNEPYATFPPD